MKKRLAVFLSAALLLSQQITVKAANLVTPPIFRNLARLGL